MDPTGPVEPHIPNHFDDYSFTPGSIAGEGDVVWVADQALSLLLRIDGQTGEIAGPFPVATSVALSELAYSEGLLFGRTDSDLVFFDTISAESTTVAMPGVRVAPDGDAVWTTDGGPSVVLVGREGVRRRADLGRYPTCLEVAGGSLWALCAAPSERSTLLRIDTESGEVVSEQDLKGTPRGLAFDGTVVWARSWVFSTAGEVRVETYLFGVDPTTGSAASQIAFEAAEAGPVVDGVIWVDDEPEETEHELDFDEPGPVTVRGLRATDGAVLQTAERAAPAARWTLVDGRAWAPLWTWDGPQLTMLDPKSGQSRIFEFEHLDLTPYLPAPPRPRLARDAEHEVRDQLAEVVFWRAPGGTSYISGITFESVELEGSFPETAVVMLFRSNKHPGILFGRRVTVWEDGALCNDIDVVPVNLMEDIETGDPGLPKDPSPTNGIVWF